MTTRVIESEVEFIDRKLATPLVLSSGTVAEVTEARVAIVVEADGKTARGRGSIYLSDLWAWPDPALDHAHKDAALRALCERIVGQLPEWCAGPAHPLELGLHLHDRVCGDETFDVPPLLARSMAASPFDAALHDATGIALERSAFDLYQEDFTSSADEFFDDGSASHAIRDVLRPPVSALPAWRVVGKGDSLDDDLRLWIQDKGYGCFKLKIMGRDNAEDVARTVEVYRAVCGHGVAEPRLTIDSNEANPDADSVLDYLERLRAADSSAFAALQYIEQPTARDIEEAPFDWRAVTRHKPVLLDEGLTHAGLMPIAQDQGWSGFALKTCKGHSFALVAAAWAHRNGMQLALQDLTNPGFSLIHAALLAARLPTINGVELNAAQFTPDANADWLPRLAPLMAPEDGTHRLSDTTPHGLGSGL